MLTPTTAEPSRVVVGLLFMRFSEQCVDNGAGGGGTADLEGGASGVDGDREAEELAARLLGRDESHQLAGRDVGTEGEADAVFMLANINLQVDPKVKWFGRQRGNVMTRMSPIIGLDVLEVSGSTPSKFQTRRLRRRR